MPPYKSYPVIPGLHRGEFLLPAEENALIRLNPVECTLFRLFLTHSEGIASAELPAHREEISRLYAGESVFDEPSRQEIVIATLCRKSHKEFYSSVSRIKKKLKGVLGARRANRYCIKRRKDGKYYTRAAFIKV